MFSGWFSLRLRGGLVDLGLGFVGWVVLCYVGCGLLLVLGCGLRWFCCGRLYVLDLVWGGFFLDFVSVLWLLILGCLLLFWCFLVCEGWGLWFERVVCIAWLAVIVRVWTLLLIVLFTTPSYYCLACELVFCVWCGLCTWVWMLCRRWALRCLCVVVT